MQKNKNRSGLALGIIGAILATAFGAAPASNAYNETAPVVFPNAGTAAQNQILHGESFELVTRVGTAQVASSATWSYKIEKSSASAAIVLKHNLDGSNTIATATESVSVSTTVGYFTTSAQTQNKLAISFPALTSVSPEVTVTVTPYRDLDGNVSPSAGDVFGDPYVVSFVPWTVLGSSLILSQPIANDQGATSSVTVQQGTLNWAQLNGNFHIQMTHASQSAFVTKSAAISAAQLSATSGTSTGTAGSVNGKTGYGNYSASFNVMTVPFSTSSRVDSLSAQLFYDQNADGSLAESEGAAVATKLAVSAQTITGVTVSPVAGSNLKFAATGVADARVNSAFTLNAFAHSISETTSMAVATVFTVSAESNIDFDADSGVTIAGTTYTTSAALLAAGVTLPAGTTTVAVSTFGQDDTTLGSITFVGKAQGITATALRVDLKTATYTPKYTPTNAASPAGAAKTFALTVKDQWQVSSPLTNQRIAASVVLGGSTSETVSAAVVSGVASVTVTPVPATRTGSATVTFTLQALSAATGLWVDGNTDTAAWNVYSAADSITSRTASKSASVSYDALTYTANIAVVVANSYSDVVVSAPGLIVADGDDATVTASGTLTVQATNQTANFKFAGRVAGTYTVTITNGSASTTSQVIIDPASGEAGNTVTITAVSSAVAGRAIDVTVTVKDVNGNPVDTATASQLTVEAAGVGFFLGGGRIQTATTNANGQAFFTLTSDAAATGNLTLTASYDGTADTSSTAVVAIAPAAVATAQTVSVVASAATVEAGKNADVTITVTDSDGKAHAYKTVVVYSTGAGYLSAQTVTTDGNGKAVVKLITGANESGTATITASVGGKSGTATVTVAAPVVVVPEVTAVVGSFNGRWAVRVENAKGSAVTIKVGGNWYNVTATSNNFVFSRKSVVGATPLVKVWVDGELQNEQTITVK